MASARIPVVLYAAGLSQALPMFAAILRRGRPLSAPARIVLVWCGLLVLGDVASLAITRLQGENLWTQYIVLPLESYVAIWALSMWQPQGVLRLAYRLAIPALLVMTTAVLLVPERAPAFDQIVTPIYSLVLLIAALHTLVHRSLTTESWVTQEDWFWISLGMSTMFATAVAIRPFSQAFIESRRDWVVDAYIAKGWTDILAFLLITRGILLRDSPQLRFGGRS